MNENRKIQEYESWQHLQEIKIPEEYRSFYTEKNGRLLNTEYSEKTQYSFLGDIHNTVFIPELIVASKASDIQLSEEARHVRPNYEGYYDDAGMPQTTYEYYSGLEKYYFFPGRNQPIYVFDNHGHALFAWREAKEAGTLNGQVALIRLDAHTDMEPARQDAEIDSRHAVKQALSASTIDIKNFTEPALRNGLIDEMYFCSGSPLSSIDNLIGSENNRKRYPELHTIYSYRNRFKDITLPTLQDPQYLEGLINELADKGKRVILDIDFDMFEDRKEDDSTVKQQKDKIRKRLPQIAHRAHLITCATSPEYANQKEALTWVKDFIDGVLSF